MHFQFLCFKSPFGIIWGWGCMRKKRGRHFQVPHRGFCGCQWPMEVGLAAWLHLKLSSIWFYSMGGFQVDLVSWINTRRWAQRLRWELAWQSGMHLMVCPRVQHWEHGTSLWLSQECARSKGTSQRTEEGWCKLQFCEWCGRGIYLMGFFFFFTK